MKFQILRSLRRGRSIAPLLLFLPAAAPTVGAQPDRPAAIRYSEARSHAVSQTVELPATVVARRVSTVAGEVSGLVLEYPLRSGERVERGQVVARLRDQRLRLDLEAARAQLEEDRTRLALAERNLGRARQLFDRGVFSRQQLDDADFEQQALARRIQRLEAEIARLQEDIDRSVIVAPFPGVVVRELTQVGEWLEEGGGVVELMATEELEIEVPVPERYVAQLNRSRRGGVRFEAIADLRLRLPVAAVIPRADPQSRTFPVRLALSRPDPRIAVGMVALVTLALGGTREVTIVPKDAIVRQGEQEFVYLLGEGGTVRQVEVDSGLGIGDWVEVNGPVAARDRVITRGNERLRPGQAVTAEPLEYALP